MRPHSPFALFHILRRVVATSRMVSTSPHLLATVTLLSVALQDGIDTILLSTDVRCGKQTGLLSAVSFLFQSIESNELELPGQHSRAQQSVTLGELKMVAARRVPTSNGQYRAAGVVLVAALVMSWMSAANAQADAPAAGTDPNEGNPSSIGWFQAHGWLMWLAFGIFLPLGVLVSRFGQNYFSQWLWAHISLQVTGVILSTIAFVIAVKKFEVTTWDNTHVKLGLAIMVLVWLQPISSLIRPRRGTAVRPAWFVVHWLFGTAAIILAWFNIFKGLDLYVQSWPSGGERKASSVLWGINVGILAFLYLFLERLPYIRFQAKDPNVNPNMTSTELTNKSNRDSATRADV